MLQLFRSGLTSYFATALIGLLIASFALWGIGGDVLSGAGSKVAEIGDDKVTMNEYAREFQNKFSEIQQQSNGEITREMVIDQGMTQKWLAELVQSKTFAHAAHSLNIRVTDAQLRDFIMGIEAFQDTFGEFSKSAFENIAGNRGYTSGEFEEILRRDLERQYLMTSIVSGITVPNSVEKIFIKYLTEERTAEIITIPAYSITDIPEADEETLKKYYQDNAANYMAPEYRDISFITLSVKDFMDDITVTDDEIEQAMGNAANTVDGGEMRDFEQILFDDKASADKAYADLEAGRSFLDIITAAGSTSDDAAVFGNSMQDISDTYGTAAAEAVFNTPEGKYSQPVEDDFGWRIFKVTGISASAGKSGNSRAEIEEALKHEKAIDLLYDKSELINDELAAGGSIADIAGNLGLELKTAVNIDASGYNAKGDLVRNIPDDPAFLATVFEILLDDEPMLEEMGEGEYFLAVVDNIQESALRPFEEVKTSVRDIWQADVRKNIARERANEILAKAQDGATMEELSRMTPDTSYTSVTLARNDQTGKVTQNIHRDIFSLDIGRAKIMPAADGNGFVVLKVTARNHPKETIPASQTAQLKQYLAQEYQQRLLSNYWRYLEDSLPVRINQRAVNAVHDQLASREQ